MGRGNEEKELVSSPHLWCLFHWKMCVWKG